MCMGMSGLERERSYDCVSEIRRNGLSRKRGERKKKRKKKNSEAEEKNKIRGG